VSSAAAAFSLPDSAPVICCSGGMIARVSGETLFTFPIPRDQARLAYELARDIGLLFLGFADRMLYVGEFGENLGKVIDYSCHFGKVRREVHLTPEEFGRLPLDDLLKFEVYSRDAGALERYHALLEQTDLNICRCGASIEISARGMGKGAALKRLAESMGIDPADIMAFGDSGNDVDLLRSVGWPVAVGNAAEELKAVARVIAPDAAEDGVARTLRKYVLGE
jgi:HAD superfamily hydrolase (TIGR01484 family)